MNFLNERWLMGGIAAAVAMLGLTGTAMAAQRHVILCNKSNMNYEVAVGYDLTGTSESTSRGWITVRSCACETLFNDDVRATEFFYYVTKKGGGVADALSSGRGPLCVSNRGFRFLSENASRAACNNAGGTWVNFAFGNAERPSHTVNFRVGNSVCQ
jgi:uncharacterized membrane protein